MVVAGLLWLGVEVAAGLTLQAWDDRRQLVGAQRLTVALETFRPSSHAGLSQEVAVTELAPDRAVHSDPARCTPLSLLAVKGALGGESWTGVNGSPDQPVNTLTVRYADASGARDELSEEARRAREMRRGSPHVPAVRQARRGFHHRRAAVGSVRR